eukprot:6869721-Alexandrium_andersonii.AAC.1
MSASLVGSEMCIRDRAWLPQHPFHFPQQAVALRARRKQHGRRRRASVSYTHLTLPTICSV